MDAFLYVLHTSASEHRTTFNLLVSMALADEGNGLLSPSFSWRAEEQTPAWLNQGLIRLLTQQKGEPDHLLDYTAGPLTISHRFLRETSEPFCPLTSFNLGFRLAHREALLARAGIGGSEGNMCIASWLHFRVRFECGSPHKMKSGSAPVAGS